MMAFYNAYIDKVKNEINKIPLDIKDRMVMASF